MPAVPSPSSDASVRVLVSGANGFIALHVVSILLEQGFTVRGTVRSAEKGRLLAERFQGTYGERFEWIVVDDIAKDGAFDNAVKDVDAIQHIASPAGVNQTDDQSPDVYIQPAVQGTLGILRSALRFGHSVKRIILTSSTTAIWRLNITESDSPLPVILDENDWCEDSLAEVRNRGSDAPVLAKYSASKALSEQAAWEFYREHQNEVGWDLVALLPAMVIGVPLTDIKSPDSLPDSLSSWFRFIFHEQPEFILKVCYGYVDVTDCANALVTALAAEKVGGERIIICAGSTTFQDNRNLILSLASTTHLTTPMISAIRGNPALQPKMLYKYNSEKGKTLLGLEYRDLTKTCGELVDYFLAKGWLMPMERKKEEDDNAD